MMLSKNVLLFLLFAALVSQVLSTSPPDYSGAKEPVIFLRIQNLEPKRESLTLGTDVVPASNGFLYLECDIMLQSLGSVPNGHKKNATVTWELPNPKILEENRALDSYSVGGFSKNSAKLAITDFRAEDVGEYTCRLNLDGEPTEFKRSIYVPELDGSPLLSCELSCTRNKDDRCQLLEYFSIRCEAHGFPEPRIHCNFQECETEAACPLPVYTPPDPFFGFGTDRAMYSHKVELVADDLALRSGRYDCEGKSYKGNALVSIFVPVSHGEEKMGGPRLPPPPIYVPEGSPDIAHPPVEPPILALPEERDPVFLGKLTPKYYSIDEEVKMTCWTNFVGASAIGWAYRNASSPDTMEMLTSASNPDFQFITDENVSGGQLSQIVVKSAKLEHGGIYECGVTTISGRLVTKELAMETYRWADDADMNQDRQVTIAEGGSVTMKCSIITTKHDPQIRWFKNGVFLESNPTTTFSPDKQILTLTSLVPPDSGVYTCTSRGRFSLVRYDLEGKTTLTVTEAADPALHVQIINNVISSLSTVQDHLTDLAKDLHHYVPVSEPV